MFNSHFYAKLKKSACYAKHSKYASFLTKINILFCEKNEKKIPFGCKIDFDREVQKIK